MIKLYSILTQTVPHSYHPLTYGFTETEKLLIIYARRIVCYSQSYLDTQKHTANVQVWRYVKFKDVTRY